MIAELVSASEVRSARALIERSGLVFEDGFDVLVGAYDQGELVAVGARAGRVLKMLAVDPEQQGGPLLGDLVTELVSSGFSAGHEAFFVFTKPEYASTFAALNFKLLASQGKAVLLEYGKGLAAWLATRKSLVRSGTNGAVVMNCNPFTLGHRYLVESAARQVDHLYLFVVREERSVFPFAVRDRLVREGVADLDNVIVLDTSSYLVSAATFPRYFLKRDDPAARIQMELDVTLFASRIAPFFGIFRRFAGTEPSCRLTDGYNETMRRLLPVHGIEFVEIERIEVSGSAISASRVRELMTRGELASLNGFVPESTLAYLASPAAADIRDQLQQKA